MKSPLRNIKGNHHAIQQYNKDVVLSGSKFSQSMFSLSVIASKPLNSSSVIAPQPLQTPDNVLIKSLLQQTRNDIARLEKSNTDSTLKQVAEQLYNGIQQAQNLSKGSYEYCNVLESTIKSISDTINKITPSRNEVNNTQQIESLQQHQQQTQEQQNLDKELSISQLDDKIHEDQSKPNDQDSPPEVMPPE